MSTRSGGAGGKATGGANRNLDVRVKTAKKRSHASTLWLARQLNDPYVQAAKREGYRSRAAFKLIEIDDKHKFLKPGQKIVDLGAAPGGWSQIAADRIGSKTGKGAIVAIDLLEMEPMPSVDFMVLDFLDDSAPDILKERLRGKADVVLSDMAANTVGHQRTDHLRIMALVEAAAMFAAEVLAPGGAFLAKVFQGGAEGDLLKTLKRDYAKVMHVKPPSSRKDSSELYVLATGFRGRAAQADDD
ncbi:RlmE family RNA methyltransferase [Hansschlegelia plantiphila]|uniref:Ribosomal RNA large subunit methyltransferase E n=1 Tax=Hansschlegelia plantiphila TaxID=374655 RepID=A0A9W6IXR3_9HYPH|nr:RlmE family RNA methyltransferase [Hansschlegelia plantiphila]GLK66652.1 ribosomal RNA large subunit methyltransferase E [Hansschlegelia plantiphila]